MKIAGLSVVITGATSGLGAACARRLVEAGARVAVWDGDADLIHALAEEIPVFPQVVHVQDPHQVQAALAKTQSHQGVPRALINGAQGVMSARIVGRHGPHPLEDFTHMLMIHAVGTFNVMRLVAHAMAGLDPLGEDGERGVVINTGSIAAEEGQVGQAAYAAAMGSVAAMTVPAARELSRFGIRVNTIASGALATRVNPHVSQKAWEHVRSQFVFPRRLGKPDEFAALAMHIVENVFINGQIMRLDGGLRLPG